MYRVYIQTYAIRKSGYLNITNTLQLYYLYRFCPAEHGDRLFDYNIEIECICILKYITFTIIFSRAFSFIHE